MFHSGILDVVIGLVFIYLLYSLLATIIQEMIATTFSFRAKILEHALVRMLEDTSGGEKKSSWWKELTSLFVPSTVGDGIPKGDGTVMRTVDLFYRHPLVRFLGENDRNRRPSYLTRDIFSKVIIDLLRGRQVKPGTDLRPLIEHSLVLGKTAWDNAAIDPETKKYLESVWTDAQGNIDLFRQYLETWFDQTMERATGWYKRKTQFILFFIGLVLAILFNVDTIRIAAKLEKDPKLREQLVQQADAFVKAHPTLDQDLVRQQAELKELREKMGGTSVTAVAHDSLSREKAKLSLDSALTAKISVKRDSLLDAADSLLRVDIAKTNDLLGLGFGQIECNSSCRAWCFLRALLGWILTALALSLGAPFWFDLLSKLMKVRNSAGAAIAAQTDHPQQKEGNPATPKTVG